MIGEYFLRLFLNIDSISMSVCRYLKWIEEVEKMFGGLDICAVKGVIDNNSKEYITQVCKDQVLTKLDNYLFK